MPSTSYDPAVLSGWGKRAYNWEFSAGVQRELSNRVGLDVSYFRRIYGNFMVTDNRAVAAADYNGFRSRRRSTRDCPAAAATPLNGLFDLNPSKVGQVNNYVTFANNYGKQIEHWNGVDVTVNARPRPGILLQGGVSTGRTSTDNCAIRAARAGSERAAASIPSATSTRTS